MLVRLLIICLFRKLQESKEVFNIHESSDQNTLFLQDLDKQKS